MANNKLIIEVTADTTEALEGLRKQQKLLMNVHLH